MATECTPNSQLTCLQEEEKDLDGLRCYFVGSGEKAVIVFPDIFGYDFWLMRLMCKLIADNGYFVAFPDIFHGDSWPPELEFGENFSNLFKWLKKFPWHSKVKPDAHKLVNHLKSRGCTSIGSFGFCCGAYLVLHLSADESLNCGLSLHPSYEIPAIYDESLDEMAKLIKCPQYLCVSGGESPTFSKGGNVYEILEEKFGEKNGHKSFPEMNHAFFIPDEEVEDEARVTKEVKIVMKGIIEFLRKSL